MNASICARLDDYLADDLEPAGRIAFESHLAQCALCREEVRLQTTINRLLAAAQPSPPPQLQGNIAASIRRRKLRHFARLTAAAALLLGSFAAWRLWTAKELPPHSAPSAQQGSPSDDTQFTETPGSRVPLASPVEEPISNGDALAKAAAAVDAGGSAIVVAQPSQDPTVHIFWLYPTVNVSMTAPGDSTEPADLERNPL